MTTDTRQLADLVSRKLEVLTLLARLGRQQLAVIDGGDMGLLMKLLAAKQALLEASDAARVIGQERGQDLQSDLPAEPRIARSINLAHTAGTDRGNNLVRAQPEAGRECHRGRF